MNLPPMVEQLMERVATTEMHQQWLTMYADNLLTEIRMRYIKIIHDADDPDILCSNGYVMDAVRLARIFDKLDKAIAFGRPRPQAWRKTNVGDQPGRGSAEDSGQTSEDGRA